MEKRIINIGDKFVCYAHCFSVPNVKMDIETDSYDDVRESFVEEVTFLQMDYEPAIYNCSRDLNKSFNKELAFTLEYIGEGKAKEITTGKEFSVHNLEDTIAFSDIEKIYLPIGKRIEGIDEDSLQYKDNYYKFISNNPLIIELAGYYDETTEEIKSDILCVNDNEKTKELCSEEDSKTRRDFVVTMEEYAKRVTQKSKMQLDMYETEYNKEQYYINHATNIKR